MSTHKVGVIGGGQLAWMMSDAAQKLNLELIVQTPNLADPAVKIAKNYILAAIDDADGTKKLADFCDVITFENEFINLEALKSLAVKGTSFRPSLEALSPLLDKYDQRCYLQKIGLPVPQFVDLSSQTEIESPFGYPVVLKVRRHGYDGKGTFILKNQAELTEIWQKLRGLGILAEEFIAFDRELAVMAARNSQGEIVVYPVVESKQEKQVCRWVIAPANISVRVRSLVEAIARQLLEALQVVGIFGIELFLTSDEQVLVNEVAPRTHNSGHYTLDACLTSQFEQQLRAVMGLPLGSPALKSDGAVMVNLLGYENSDSDYQEKRDRLAAIPNTYVHWYGKSESRQGRKLGHVTVLLTAAEMKYAQQKIQEIEAIWYETN